MTEDRIKEIEKEYKGRNVIVPELIAALWEAWEKLTLRKKIMKRLWNWVSELRQ